MATMYVNVEALNFRSSPTSELPDNITGTVFLGQRLTSVADAEPGWVRCKATIDGDARQGFVSRKYLRQPLSDTREALVASVHREWMRFRRGTGLEFIAPFSGFVGEMWRAVGSNLDGTDRGVPWSAAAISFMVRNAGEAYAGFRFSTQHSQYIHHAIKAREREDRAVPFWGYRIDERKPQVGDIICKDNPEFAPAVNYEVARQLSDYRSHCDIVMWVDSPGQKVIAIGGNVSQSVHTSVYDLAPGDLLANTRHVFALLKNVTDA